MAFDPNSHLKSLNSDIQPAKRFFLLSKAKWAGDQPEPRQIDPGVVEAYTAKLRELVKEWIASGKENLGNANEVDALMNRKLKTSTHQEMAEWLQRNPRRQYVNKRGELRDGPPAHLRELHDPNALMKEVARGEFFELMQSEFKFKIAQCGRCSKFFYRKRLRKYNKDGTCKYYKNGSYCPRCRNAAASERTTHAKRAEEKEAMLKIAASAWAKWLSLSKTTQAKYGTKESYALSKIESSGKTAKWITRNLKDIKRRAQEVTNAKG